MSFRPCIDVIDDCADASGHPDLAGPEEIRGRVIGVEDLSHDDEGVLSRTLHERSPRARGPADPVGIVQSRW